MTTAAKSPSTLSLKKKVVEASPAIPKINKMSVATEIYERMIGEGKARKEILAAFVSEAGLTVKGAPTYFQTIKTKSKK